MTGKITTINPTTGATLATYEGWDTAQIEKSVMDAHHAARTWGMQPLQTRIDAVLKIANELRQKKTSLAKLMTLEMGKPLREAEGEVEKSAVTAEYYAKNAEKLLADESVHIDGVNAWVSYEPIGLVLAVMPWNFPYWQVIRFAAPTLAAGNGGMLKHASNVTGSAIAIQHAIEKAGFPKGLFTSLVVADHAMVNTIVEDNRIAAVTLTGSEKAGASVAEAAGRALKKTVLELGGSDPFVILEDADSEAIAPFAVKARFINTGQSCLCAKRFIVADNLVDDFEGRIKTLVEALKIGDPLDPSTQLGPLAKKAFVDDIDKQVQDSIKLGARLVTGGHRIDGPGNFYAPTILADVTPDMPVFNQETFGPVLALVGASSSEQAIKLANTTQYGLAASIWTKDPSIGVKLGAGISSGALFVNGVVASDPRLPFGGVKLSGYGRELSIEGLHEFMNVRAVWIGNMPTV